jgi:hypothetical protein
MDVELPLQQRQVGRRRLRDVEPNEAFRCAITSLIASKSSSVSGVAPPS